MVAYHDDEWGVPVADDRALFERLALESFQAGLSWATILRKREAFRSAFAGFAPQTVAAFDGADRERLLADAGIVRNQAKIDATVNNAGFFLKVAAEHGSFAGYLASFLPRPAPVLTSAQGWADVPATTPESDALSVDLRRRGFRFVDRRSSTHSCRASAWWTITCRAASGIGADLGVRPETIALRPGFFPVRSGNAASGTSCHRRAHIRRGTGPRRVRRLALACRRQVPEGPAARAGLRSHRSLRDLAARLRLF
jgi:DNA-3-methyladenine glycosylase I